MIDVHHSRYASARMHEAMYDPGMSWTKDDVVAIEVSSDGLSWHKNAEPVVSPGGRWDAAKCSEMSMVGTPWR